MSAKVLPTHLAREAAVYLRQSTLEQVRENRESTERQYALVERAVALGWPRDAVRVLDGDLGKSGKTTAQRGDFQSLCAAVGLGQIGAVLALEASRLSRSQADWHRLLELCAWTHTLLVDHDGVYDPNDFNDRVLLGFKGTWSHTELHAMRLRLHGARRHAAQKGELRLRPPTGYVHDEDGALVFDPDEGVVAAVRGVFDTFRSLGTAWRVARHHAERGLLFPVRLGAAPGKLGALAWRPLRDSRVSRILHNPIYAGAYVYGRRPVRPVVQDGVWVGSRQISVPTEAWEVLIRDAHPGYITWDDLLENERLLAMNRTRIDTGHRQGPPRGGAGLLQGIVLCGRCGRRMQVRYRGGDGGQYLCPRPDPSARRSGPAQCWVAPMSQVDPVVERHVLDEATRDNLDLSLRVLDQLERDEGRERRDQELRLERARQEVARAERQFQLCEPDNRLVARTLERRWEEKLGALAELEEALREPDHPPRLELTAEQRTRILALASDLRTVWNAHTTTQQDRKELLSLLVRQIALEPQDLPRPRIRIRVLWHTGRTTETVMDRMSMSERFRTSATVLELIRELMPAHTDAEIARILCERGLRTGRGRPFTKNGVMVARHNHGLMRTDKDKRAAARLEPRADGRYSALGIAALAGVPVETVRRCREGGHIEGIKESVWGAWWYEATTENIDALRVAHGTSRRAR